MIHRFRSGYGADPVHLVAQVVGFAVAIWGFRQILGGGYVINYIAWFVGAAVLHDLIALPCSHPDCCSIGYFLGDGKGTFRSLAAIVGEDDLKRSLSVVANSIAFTDSLAQVRAALGGVGEAVNGLAASTQAGSAFVFGYLAGGAQPFPLASTGSSTR